MNRDEAKSILLLHRTGSADAGDPQIAAALALARQDPELSRWLDEYGARQQALQTGFRQIAVPAGLKEQIIYEQAARERAAARRRRGVRLALAVAVVALVVVAPLWLHQQSRDDTLAIFQRRMARIALSPYAMDLASGNPAEIRAFLAQKQAPADYLLPTALERAAVTGCAVEGWQDTKVAMICFRTGRMLPPGQSSDLWLFVVDRSRVRHAPPPDTRRFARVNQLTTVTWTQGDWLYVLGTAADEATLRQYL